MAITNGLRPAVRRDTLADKVTGLVDKANVSPHVFGVTTPMVGLKSFGRRLAAPLTGSGHSEFTGSNSGGYGFTSGFLVSVSRTVRGLLGCKPRKDLGAVTITVLAGTVNLLVLKVVGLAGSLPMLGFPVSLGCRTSSGLSIGALHAGRCERGTTTSTIRVKATSAAGVSVEIADVLINPTVQTSFSTALHAHLLRGNHECNTLRGVA